MRAPSGLLLLGILLAACGPTTGSPTPSPSTAPTPTPASTQPAGTATSTPGPGTVAIDASLLDVLPETVDGLDLVESPDAELAALDDPQLEAVAASIAAGIAVDPATGGFVYAVVVRLLPNTMNETVYRDWRDSYDEGACSQAGGVAGHAETEIGGRTVYIGTCAGGLRTYHVWLEEKEVLISVSAVGERRLGEHLVENLRP